MLNYHDGGFNTPSSCVGPVDFVFFCWFNPTSWLWPRQLIVLKISCKYYYLAGHFEYNVACFYSNRHFHCTLIPFVRFIVLLKSIRFDYSTNSLYRVFHRFYLLLACVVLIITCIRPFVRITIINCQKMDILVPVIVFSCVIGPEWWIWAIDEYFENLIAMSESWSSV